jgi:hypothetical protein
MFEAFTLLSRRCENRQFVERRFHEFADNHTKNQFPNDFPVIVCKPIDWASQSVTRSTELMKLEPRAMIAETAVRTAESVIESRAAKSATAMLSTLARRPGTTEQLPSESARSTRIRLRY